MTKTLFLAWQDKRDQPSGRGATRQWFPIGRLDAESGRFLFRYTHGAERASAEAGFQPLSAFPDLHRHYRSDQLFALFRNRVPRAGRADYPGTLERLGLSPGEKDPFEILAVSGGTRRTDNLEAFPRIRKHRDGRFHCRFFIHGWRYMQEAAQHRLHRLAPDEPLRVALELNNPATGLAVQLQTDDYCMIGWSPRYLVEDLVHAISCAPAKLDAIVQRVNPPPAPANQRVLVALSGSLPEEVEPMSSKDFQPLAA